MGPLCPMVVLNLKKIFWNDSNVDKRDLQKKLEPIVDIWIDFSLALAQLYFVTFGLAAAAQTWKLSNVTPVRILPEPKMFYTSAICDKFHVCCAAL